VEATCIKSYLLHQNPDSVYFHTNLGSLKTLGKYWDQLYQDKRLKLEEKLRVKMMKDSSELDILGIEL